MSLTLLAIGVGWFSLVSTLGGVAGLLLGTGPEAQVGPWLGVTVLATGLLGLRAARRMWRVHPNAAGALRAFIAVGALVPIALYAAIPPDHRNHALWPVCLGTATFVALGLWIAQKTGRISPGAV